MKKPQPEDITALLLALKKDAENAIDAAQQVKDSFNEAINWGDLHVVDVQACIGIDGVTVYRVEIEEVSPMAARFWTFILGKLSQAGWTGVDVELSW